MLGTLVNAAAILVGGLLGMLLKKGLKENFRDTLNAGVSLAVVFVGVSSALGAMLQPDASPVLFIVALALGGLAGEWINIEGALERLGAFLQSKAAPQKQNGLTAGSPSLSQGFVAASLVFCVGTMAVLGSLEAGVQGNHSILFAKALLDGIIALVMASTLGIGVLFSALSVLAYQGLLTLLAVWLSPFLTADMLREMSIVGGILICTIGLNMLDIFKARVRVGNLLPGLLVPVLYYAITGLWSK